MTDDTIDEARLRDLMNEVSALPTSIDPPKDAWAKIRAEITKADRSDVVQIRFWQRPIFLAAAALLLIAGSSVVTAIAVNRRATSISGEKERQVAAVADTNSGPSSLAQFTVVENDYLRAVNDLSATLESEQDSLSPETIAKLRASIKVIDSAILEARSALAADPANKTLIQMLAKSYEQKVDLLKRTTEMARS